MLNSKIEPASSGGFYFLRKYELYSNQRKKENNLVITRKVTTFAATK